MSGRRASTAGGDRAAVGDLGDGEAAAAQHTRGGGPEGFVVVDDEHGDRCAGLGDVTVRYGADRQPYGERAAHVRSADELDGAAQDLDESPGVRQAEPGPGRRGL